MTYRISTKLNLPKGAELWTFADLAIKGAGKTYAASVLAEELIKGGIPIIAIDSMGIWWGLRVGVNGHDGLPVVVFGGKHKDLDIPTKIEKMRPIVDEERLRLMVKAILEARMSAVIDTSDFSKGMRRRIIAIFASELYRLNQDYGSRHVFLEEADEWIPQKLHGKDEWASACFGAIDDLVRKGGNFLLGCTMITQRSAVLSKDVLSQINCLIVLRILHKGDKEAVQGWVESVADPHDKRIAKWYDSLKGLKNGEAWVWNPQADIFDKIQFRERETLHATREYFTRSQFEQKDIAMMDVGAFVAKFKSVFEPKKIPEQPKQHKIVEVKPLFNVPLQKDEKIVKHDTKIGETTYRYEHRVLEEGDGEKPVIQQALPNIEIHQFKPTINIPVEILNEPTTALGRVVVVLWNYQGRTDRWSLKTIKEQVVNHAWDENGISEAVDQLIRWEIIKKQSNNYLKFYSERVQIVEKQTLVEAS